MWFKHLHLYRLHGAPELDSQTLANALDEHAAKPLGNADARRLGWTAPAGRLGGDQRVHEIQGHRLLSALRQERLLPASVVKEEVDEKVADIEASEGRKVTRKEKNGTQRASHRSALAPRLRPQPKNRPLVGHEASAHWRECQLAQPR